MASNKDIIEKLECVESRLTNGELEEIHQTVKEIKSRPSRGTPKWI